ncbi:MAG: phosphogluconate dehydratase [Candidatus Azotimanducaceae bacterium]
MGTIGINFEGKGVIVHPIVQAVTDRVRDRSHQKRSAYLARLEQQAASGPARGSLSCSNLAHGMAACSADDKGRLTDEYLPNIAIVSAYNDILSAHQPYESYPDQIRKAATELGAVAQVAGGVPAMCDGVTQGQDGMELSLFSRDVIALATGVALSHNMFDATMYLGICDKIVPGLLIGALSFGHLPAIFVPAGPMRSGISNKEKARVREAFAAGEVDKTELIAVESASYHSAGTCTFYGTANSNQMLMEIMGLQLPGSSFINPDDPMRPLLTNKSVQQVLTMTRNGNDYRPVGKIVDEAAVVNGIVGLLATGGSTNHTLHLVAIAAAAGISINWEDMSALSKVVPLLAQVYPNGLADINHFHAAGGLAFIITELLSAGLLHEDVETVAGSGLSHYTRSPHIEDTRVVWKDNNFSVVDADILRPVSRPFKDQGGICLVQGNLGRAIVKTSAVEQENQSIAAPAKIFISQAAFVEAFEAGELVEDMVAVLPGQGPAANGMPELHKLTPFLGVMQNRGLKVALLTDGRMSGASGKILAGIQVTPEAVQGGMIGRIQDGDLITIDAVTGVMMVDADLAARPEFDQSHLQNTFGMGREMFSMFRANVGSAEAGASVFQS